MDGDVLLMCVEMSTRSRTIIIGWSLKVCKRPIGSMAIWLCVHCVSWMLDVINGSNNIEVKIDIERMNQFFVTQSLPQNELEFEISLKLCVSEFSFITFESKEAVMSVKSNASVVYHYRTHYSTPQQSSS
jgi:hypothetical protein